MKIAKIPPGSYTLATLPPISPEAEQILARVKEKARKKPPSKKTSKGPRSRGLQ